jgi:hypothetical protein
MGGEFNLDDDVFFSYKHRTLYGTIIGFAGDRYRVRLFNSERVFRVIPSALKLLTPNLTDSNAAEGT